MVTTVKSRTISSAFYVCCFLLLSGLSACGGGGSGTTSGSSSSSAANAVPSANAGAEQTVLTGAAVTLSGSGSDTDGTIASYAWTQTAGDAVTLSGADTATLSFTAPAAATSLTFQLTVTDNLGASHSDTVVVTVNAATATAPTIARDPMNTKAYEHGSALLFVVAAGENLTYEWHNVNFGTVFNTRAEPFLLRTDLRQSDDGDCYYVIVSNDAGSVTSEPGCVEIGSMSFSADFSDEYYDDDDGLAEGYADSLLAIAMYAAGGVAGYVINSGDAVVTAATGVPVGLSGSIACDSGSYVGSTLDGQVISNAQFLPLGQHTISMIWDECGGPDDYVTEVGGILITYDFPTTFGVGTATFHMSGYRPGSDGSNYKFDLMNGTLQVTTTMGTGTSGNPVDQTQIQILEDFTLGYLRRDSSVPGVINLECFYDSDALTPYITRADVDFDAPLSVYDLDGNAGTLTSGGMATLQYDPNEQEADPYSSSGQLEIDLVGWGVGGGTYNLSTLEPVGGTGWRFSALPHPE